MTVGPMRYDLLLISAGGVIWAVRFAVVYALTAIACAQGWAAASFAGFRITAWLIGAATLVALMADLVVILHAARKDSWGEADLTAMVRAGTIGLALLSMLAIIWEASVLTLPGCS